MLDHQVGDFDFVLRKTNIFGTKLVKIAENSYNNIDPSHLPQEREDPGSNPARV
jgi:hypothetical protein